MSPNSKDDDPQHGKGRPVDMSREEAFKKVITYVQQNDDEKTTVIDLVDSMRNIVKMIMAWKYMKLKQAFWR